MHAIYRIGQCSFGFLGATYFRWRIFHPERVPPHGPLILAANHASYFDPPLIGSALTRPISFLARESLFSYAAVAWVLRQLKVVPVDRDGGSAKGLRTILDQLTAGGGIILFPEGTRTHDGRLQPARSGIGLIVIKSQAPVIPIRLTGTFEAYGRHVRWPRPHPIRIKIGLPVPVEDLRLEARTASKARTKAIYQEVADRIMAAIGALQPCWDKPPFP
jgi:1-acyl-sn-glycerol-3-phosphate acyltransferase